MNHFDAVYGSMGELFNDRCLLPPVVTYHRDNETSCRLYKCICWYLVIRMYKLVVPTTPSLESLSWTMDELVSDVTRVRLWLWPPASYHTAYAKDVVAAHAIRCRF